MTAACAHTWGKAYRGPESGVALMACTQCGTVTTAGNHPEPATKDRTHVNPIGGSK